MTVDRQAAQLVAEAYAPLIALSDAATEDVGWTPTLLPGWSVRDLIVHLGQDALRALVALGTPSDLAADTDAVSYWRAWQPGTDAGQAALRGTRIMASVWASVRGPADQHVAAARAVITVAARTDPTDVVSTQGHVLTADSLLRTLVVEAAVHQLDLAPVLPTPPAPAVLTEVRRTLDGLLGAHAPTDWDNVTYARLGTGRQPLSPAERAALGPLADRFPLFG